MDGYISCKRKGQLWQWEKARHRIAIFTNIVACHYTKIHLVLQNPKTPSLMQQQQTTIRPLPIADVLDLNHHFEVLGAQCLKLCP